MSKHMVSPQLRGVFAARFEPLRVDPGTAWVIAPGAQTERRAWLMAPCAVPAVGVPADRGGRRAGFVSTSGSELVQGPHGVPIPDALPAGRYAEVGAVDGVNQAAAAAVRPLEEADDETSQRHDHGDDERRAGVGDRGRGHAGDPSERGCSKSQTGE